MRIGRDIRQTIFDGLRIENVRWWGALDEVAFLSAVFDLEALPSHDSRFQDAAGDIWQHRENNPDDWPHDWVFSDRRLNLLGCADETFLAFLCRMLHPVVRPDGNEARGLAAKLNEALAPAGVGLVEEGSIFGRPVYAARPLTSARSFLRHAKASADVLDAGWMANEVLRLERAVDADPDAALGGTKELIESCCKTILARRGAPAPAGVDLPKLVRLALAELKLVPDDIPDAAKGADEIRVLLNNLATVAVKIGNLRNWYGTGHGRAGNHKGLQPRHARLAVMSGIAFVTFLADTFRGQEAQRALTAPAP